MEEIFQDSLERLSIKEARLMYSWEMIKLFRPILIKNLEGVEKLNQYGMVKNYFKVALRGLLKNPLNSSINIIGLSIAIGMCIFAFSFARWTYSTDQFHVHKNEVFMVTFFANRDGELQRFGTSPRPLGELLKQDFPKVKKVCSVEDKNVVVKQQADVYNERIRFVDPEFLEMFTFPMKWGSAKTLLDLNSIIISEDMSQKYFGDENPIGRSMTIKFDKDRSKDFKVTGVAAKFPIAAAMRFNFLANLENFQIADPAYDVHDWRGFANATFVQVDKAEDIAIVGRGMEKYQRLQNDAVKEEWAISSFVFEPLATLHERTHKIRDDIFFSSDGNYTSIVFLLIINTFLLVLACINYINIAIVSASKRLKEIGVRKSIGATRKVVIVQFLAENVVITFFALVVGVIFGRTLIIPWFENLWHFDMGFKFSDPLLWIYLPALLLITGVASGIYPAFYISRFQVVNILKGSVRFGTGNPLTKFFLGFQMVLACIFITASVMFRQNSNYLAQRSWGYENREALYAVVPDQQSFEQLNAVMMQQSAVLSTSGSMHHLGKSHTTTVLHFPDRDYEVDQLSVDANYFKTMGLELSEGRLFNDHEGSDAQAVIVTELFAKNLEWQDPVGRVFQIDSEEHQVVGVVRDFHSYNFDRVMRPTFFKVAPREAYRYFSMKVKDGSELETYKVLQAKWSELFPEIPFSGGFQEDVWGNYYVSTRIYGHVWTVFASMAVILATMGLYGLVTLNVSGRTREFSIRKVLGAGIRNIAFNITRQYALLFTIAIVIGVPLSYFMVKALLEWSSPYHMPISFVSASFASLILFVVLIVTVSSQVGKISAANPVEGLKSE